MSEDKTALLVMKGAISELSPDDQKKVHEIAQQLRSIVRSNGDLGSTALALVGLELAVGDWT